MCLPAYQFSLLITVCHLPLCYSLSFCFPNHNLVPNHLERQLKVQKRESKGETKVAAKLSDQVEGGMGEHLSWHGHCFAKHEFQPRIAALGFWHKACLNVHLCAGLITCVIPRVAVPHELINSIFTDIAPANTNVRISERGDRKSGGSKFSCISPLPCLCVFNQPRCGAVELWDQFLVHMIKSVWKDGIEKYKM